MKVPPKVKMLLWHACCKAMPTKNSLFRHTISPDPLCVRCHTSSETSLHAKWSFPELDSEWQRWSYGAAKAQFNSWTSKSSYHG